VALVIVALTVAGYTSLPPLGQRTATVALEDTATTQLGQAVAPLAAAHPGRSGIHPIIDGRNAFAARVLLAAARSAPSTSSTTSGVTTSPVR